LFEILPLVNGEWESFVRGRGSDLHLIREYMPEDSARHVDWKATAKSGSLKVREFTREDERRLRIVFDNPAVGAVSEAAYERGVNLAASLAWHFAEEDAEVSFVVSGQGRDVELREFLARLAVIAPRAGAQLEGGMPGEDALREMDLGGSGEYNIVLTAREHGSLPTMWWNCSYFVFLGEQDGARANLRLSSRK
jgi:uncharacterized protein (DUF58 family)